ncbi:MAG: SDR family NAD(P)-dependent oxidoreductase, partial [Burkholderiaceae bacterium]|nr:SDR family NAD(P)-dependent oxidoreductase [Burkholderiaceae bacterium]
MQTTGNTILITGGGSGIGRALAEAFHRRGNQVIVAGRRQALLDAVARDYPGVRTATFDARDPRDIARLAAQITADFPALNAVVNNAGTMRIEDWRAASVDPASAEATIETNLLAPIRLTSALLPQLRTQPRAAVLNVSSGLAFMTMAATPTYSATKAAL